MTKRLADTTDLFEWAAARPVAEKLQPVELEHQPDGQAELIDFRERRRALPRFILNPDSGEHGIMRMLAREEGKLAPAPILLLPKRPRPPDPRNDDAPRARAG